MVFKAPDELLRKVVAFKANWIEFSDPMRDATPILFLLIVLVNISPLLTVFPLLPTGTLLTQRMLIMYVRRQRLARLSPELLYSLGIVL